MVKNGRPESVSWSWFTGRSRLQLLPTRHQRATQARPRALKTCNQLGSILRLPVDFSCPHARPPGCHADGAHWLITWQAEGRWRHLP